MGVDYVEVDTKRNCKGCCEADRRGLIVSMIHKFDKIDANLIERQNIFVLVDEAHRSTERRPGQLLDGRHPQRHLHRFHRHADRPHGLRQGTFKTFGTDDPKGYLDKYSIRESVADGTTVPLHYQLAPNELLVDRETLEKEFFDAGRNRGRQRH